MFIYECESGIQLTVLGHYQTDSVDNSDESVRTLHTRQKVVYPKIALSDTCMAVCKPAGDVYIFSDYLCTKVASRQLDLCKVQ